MQFQAHHSLWYMMSVLGTPACQTTTNNMQSDSCQLRESRTLPLGQSDVPMSRRILIHWVLWQFPGNMVKIALMVTVKKKSYCLKVQSNDISHLKNKESITIQGYVHN